MRSEQKDLQSFNTIIHANIKSGLERERDAREVYTLLEEWKKNLLKQGIKIKRDKKGFQLYRSSHLILKMLK
jgi:hypothetical protein